MPPARHAKGAGRTGDDVMCNADKLDPMPGIPLQSSRSGSRARRPPAAAGTKGDTLSRQVPRALRPATEDRPRTDAELAREATIRADPLADVQSPLWVRCRRCSQRIKLSPKSYFDLFHWQKHRERCLRRPAEELDSHTSVDDSQLASRRSSTAPVENGGGADRDGVPKDQEEPGCAVSQALSIASALSPLSESRSASPNIESDCRVSEGPSIEDDNEATTPPPPPYYPHDIFERPPYPWSPYTYAALPGATIPLESPDIDAAATLTSFNATSSAALYSRSMPRMSSERAPPLLEPRTPLVYEPRAQPLPSPTSLSWSYDSLSPAIWTVGKSSREPLDVRVPTSNVRASE